MSKKFKIGQIIGIVIGVTIGAFTVSFISNNFFGNRYQAQNVDTKQYNNMNNMNMEGVFQQALSSNGNVQNNQSKIY